MIAKWILSVTWSQSVKEATVSEYSYTFIVLFIVYDT